MDMFITTSLAYYDVCELHETTHIFFNKNMYLFFKLHMKIVMLINCVFVFRSEVYSNTWQ